VFHHAELNDIGALDEELEAVEVHVGGCRAIHASRCMSVSDDHVVSGRFSCGGQVACQKRVACRL
jgi:hypothetical protein